MHLAKIKLKWVQPKDAHSFPRGKRFARPARFDHQGEDYTENAWSLVVEVRDPIDEQGEQCGLARFLMTAAPHEWLAPRSRFTLFEGDLALATGQVEELWVVTVNEISAGCFSLVAEHVSGSKIELKGTDPDVLLKELTNQGLLQLK
jgi:hypothetical protein